METPTKPGSSNKKKKKAVYQVNAKDDGPIIGFFPKDERGIYSPRNDALVITVEIGGYEVNRIFVDNRSAADIIFMDFYEMMILEVELKKVKRALYGFNDGETCPMGVVFLSLILGKAPDR